MIRVDVPRTDPTFVVVDVETTMNSALPNKASPFDPKNSLVAVGLERVSPSKIWQGSACLVGHNLPFDWNWLRTKGVLTQVEKLMWDTQLAEYLLTGQQHHFATLDELATKYGGTLKDDKVSAYFAKGLGADHVPKALLEEYLKQDIINTRLVFEGQMVQVIKQNMMPLVLSQMEALAATTEMQYNGMAIDATLLKNYEDFARHLASLNEAELNKYNPTLDPNFSFLSNTQLGKWLYGGVHKYEERVANGVYKTGAKMGQVKYSIQKREHVFTNRVAIREGVDSHILEEIKTSCGAATKHIIDTVLKHREVSKQLTTYYVGHGKCIINGKVHPQHNHCITNTGRLSSSAPNMQNVTSDGDIKRCYISRWGKDGVLMEADYQQLEMVMLAHLSKDPQLIEDLNSGKDMHEELYNEMYGSYPTKEQRKPFKRLSFGLVYGAGAKTLAENANVPIAIARKFITVFYSRYPGVKKWHDSLVEEAKIGRYTGSTKTKKGFPAGEFCKIAETGRRYVFKEYDVPDFIKVSTGMYTGFSPTELKNYPVQGGATGDIVPLALGKLHRAIQALKNNHILLINTVHDSVLLDVHKDSVPYAAMLVRDVLQAAPTYYEETFGVPFSLKLNVNITTGPNWLEQEEYKV